MKGWQWHTHLPTVMCFFERGIKRKVNIYHSINSKHPRQRKEILILISKCSKTRYCDGNLPFCVLVTEVWNVSQGHYHHVASVDHVKMNSWCKFGECSTNRYCNIRLNHLFLTMVIQAWNVYVGQGHKPPRGISKSWQDEQLVQVWWMYHT